MYNTAYVPYCCGAVELFNFPYDETLSENEDIKITIIPKIYKIFRTLHYAHVVAFTNENQTKIHETLKECGFRCVTEERGPSGRKIQCWVTSSRNIQRKTKKYISENKISLETRTSSFKTQNTT